MKKLRLTLPILAGVIEVKEITVSEDKRVYQKLSKFGRAYHDKYSGNPVSEIPGVQNARKLFRALGIEPTKHRPSSEAMLRRFLKGKEAYSVNSLVDVSNWCALDFLLPNGVYDRSKIVGNIKLHKGRPGESYIGLNNLDVHLEDRFALADEQGPFGSPKTDSRRTCVDVDTREIIAIIYAPEDYDPKRLREQCELYSDRLIEFCGGVLESCLILNNQS